MSGCTREGEVDRKEGQPGTRVQQPCQALDAALLFSLLCRRCTGEKAGIGSASHAAHAPRDCLVVVDRKVLKGVDRNDDVANVRLTKARAAVG